ncbi:MAG: TetR/AcrR family transcriptional regulator [Ilumatobacteraceae bacterium]
MSNGSISTQPVAGALTARGARTRASVKRAARVLFEDQGFLETTVNQIARQAEVAHGTFYTYFDSKEQIFAEVVGDLWTEFNMVSARQPVVSGDLSERIERANRGYIMAYIEHARIMAAVEQAATFNVRLAEIRRSARNAWIERSSLALGRWQQRGLVSPYLDPRLTAEILGSMVDRSAYVWIVLGDPGTIEPLLEPRVREISRVYCNAIGVPYHRDDPSAAS